MTFKTNVFEGLRYMKNVLGQMEMAMTALRDDTKNDHDRHRLDQLTIDIRQCITDVEGLLGD